MNRPRSVRWFVSSCAADEKGIALLVALMSILLLGALAMTLALTALTETRVSSNYRDGVEALYAAEAGVERVILDLNRIEDWNAILDGTAISEFHDGPPTGVRIMPDGTEIDLGALTNVARCGTTSACSEADLTAINEDRPWGPNNPYWQLYAYGRMEAMVPGAAGSSTYVLVWVADDPAETDGNPLRDGAFVDDAGRGVISLLSHAYGRSGIRRVVEATVGRDPSMTTAAADESVETTTRLRVKVLSWRERR
jgi:PilX N-terminal